MALLFHRHAVHHYVGDDTGETYSLVFGKKICLPYIQAFLHIS